MKNQKRALISVFNKEGIVEFAKILTEKYDFEIISTGATYKTLTEHGINAIEVSEITGFSEMLNGKVKTLHPNIHAGILVDTDNNLEVEQIENAGIKPVEMVVGNFYPFAEAASKGISTPELIKNIDIGGPTMLRAAAKNCARVTAVSSPEQYAKVLDNLEENDGETSLELRQQLALEVFNETSSLDSLILNTLSLRFGDMDVASPDYYSYSAKKQKDLRYGENPHQSAALYSTEKVLDYDVLNGKELSYNNIMDMTAATAIASEFYDVCCVAIVKHNTPCGVALGADIIEAYNKAFDCDPISAFGGIISFTQVVNEKLAKQLVDVFLEVLIAPDYTPKALGILKTKKNLRVVKLNTPLEEYKKYLSKEIRVTPFGTLVQEADKADLQKDTFNVVSKAKPTSEMIEDMIFAWKVAKHCKSNAIVVAKDFKALGICQGQTSRVDAVEIALDRACDGSKGAVLASDGFFPAIDNIQAAAQGRIAGIIQPGGSIKDKDVIACADKYNIVMITTGIRHFRH
ncbi:MAG: bifunctional phosphoribosylaminoimidazolecarboxamide formyltransferase/IMP cyclohydrolase [Candidatus Gastranaerophilales bacterium]|nr:bifunctional phosphoribosylaminoimidazolecarboxamide formyltransferase/IMP cyclohydrolase [Candidatus Gastranaerophilales bacterium]